MKLKNERNKPVTEREIFHGSTMKYKTIINIIQSELLKRELVTRKA